ncbi:leucyl/phenylalanyl-tRNA--protein transferase, partial [bacterium LRH843]|nr:leucyl/phenylalanyl-tRNA--protein transferase [bacterium LRH843]
LLNAYASGVFPMAETRDDPEIFWVDPHRRGIFPLDKFHISRSLARRLRREEFSIRINSDFAGVVQGCADREETWINDEIFFLYS